MSRPFFVGDTYRLWLRQLRQDGAIVPATASVTYALFLNGDEASSGNLSAADDVATSGNWSAVVTLPGPGTVHVHYLVTNDTVQGRFATSLRVEGWT